VSELFRSLERRRGLVDQTTENSSRPGRSYAHYIVDATGTGSVIEPVVFDFGTSFTTLPIFTFGASVDEDGDSELPLVPPMYAAGVYKWRQDASGFYTGAWCWFVVQWLSDEPDDDFSLIFSLAWEAIASKNFVKSPNFPVSDLLGGD
jgi:hypothetical protein